jgi:hypothetical protein
MLSVAVATVIRSFVRECLCSNRRLDLSTCLHCCVGQTLCAIGQRPNPAFSVDAQRERTCFRLVARGNGIPSPENAFVFSQCQRSCLLLLAFAAEPAAERLESHSSLSPLRSCFFILHLSLFPFRASVGALEHESQLQRTYHRCTYSRSASPAVSDDE